MLWTRVAAALAIVSLCGCARLNFYRAAPSGSYFKTKTCGLQVDSRTKEARLRLQLVASRALPRDAFVETHFENPLDRAKPLISGILVTGREKTLDIVSPPLERARVRSYDVVTRIYSARDRKTLLGVHKHVCESLFDERDVR